MRDDKLVFLWYFYLVNVNEEFLEIFGMNSEFGCSFISFTRSNFHRNIHESEMQISEDNLSNWLPKILAD